MPHSPIAPIAPVDKAKGELAPGESTEARYIEDLEIAEFMAEISPDIQIAGEQWDALDNLASRATDPNYIAEVREAKDQAQGEESVSDRHSRRKQNAASERAIKRLLHETVLKARQCVTWKVYGNAAQQELISQELEMEKNAIETAEESGTVDVRFQASSQLFFEYYGIFMNALAAEDTVLIKLAQWVSYSNDRIIHLLEWMQSEDCEQRGEHKPLLEALSRIINDPGITPFITTILDELTDKPHLFQRSFVDKFAKTAETNHQDDPDASWFRFLPVVLAESGVEIPADELALVLQKIGYGDLPVTLQRRIAEQHGEAVKSTRKGYQTFLQKFNHPERFLVWDAFSQYEDSANHNNRTRSSRVSPKRTLELSPPVERLPNVTAAVVVLKSPDGYITQTIRSDKEDIADILCDSKIAQEYLDKYNSDSRIREDLVVMLKSIVEKPRGHGCSKLRPKVRFSPSEGARRPEPIWHLAPRHRHFENGLGPLADKTRIYYIVVSNGDGTETIGLLDITNKSGHESLQRGEFKRT